MRRSIRAAVLAVSLLLTVGVSGLALIACSSSSPADAQAQASPSGMPRPGGQMGDASTMFRALLARLVTKGIITSSQADTVAAGLGKAMERLRPPGSVASPGAQPTPGAQQPAGGTSTQTS